MTGIFIEPHYLPSLEFFAVLAQCDTVWMDVESAFKKQTFRNRAAVLGSNKEKNLIVPVHFNSGMPLKEVRIDYHQSWVRDHWGAFYSYYGKAAYFDHFSDMFRGVWEQKPDFLIDLNQAMLSVCLKILQWSKEIHMAHPKSGFIDLRDRILVKDSFKNRDFYQPVEYYQNFGSTFVPNLSILDLLLNHGPEASSIIHRSIGNLLERFDD